MSACSGLDNSSTKNERKRIQIRAEYPFADSRLRLFHALVHYRRNRGLAVLKAEQPNGVKSVEVYVGILRMQAVLGEPRGPVLRQRLATA
jgi:hypothetical protein